MSHPAYLSWQIDWPVFVKVPFQDYKQGDHFDWAKDKVLPERVAQLYAIGHIYHNKELEKENKVGDRLEEMTSSQLERLVTLLNVEVRNRTNSNQEFNNKKCRLSKLDAKQRGLIRIFLRTNRWIEDKFYEIRDSILN